MPVLYSEAQLAASAAAGDPLLEKDFTDVDAWHTYQNEWFATVTMGETLPAVGDSNRAKRWKATRRQRGKIEEQRARSAEGPRACGDGRRSEGQKEREAQHKRDRRAVAHEEKEQQKQQHAEQGLFSQYSCSAYNECGFTAVLE